MLSDALLFAAATLAKAWEPLSVAYAAPDQGVSFAYLLVLCELIKLLVTLAPFILLAEPRQLGWLLSKDSATGFGVPAAFLALTNHMLGFAIPRLDPLLYQILFKSLSIVITALLTRMMLGQRLRAIQQAAIVLLLAGSFLCESASQPPASQDVTAVSQDAARRGALAAVACGATSFAIQAVWFEGAAASQQNAVDRPVALLPQQSAWLTKGRQLVVDSARQAAAFALWGVLTNTAVLVLLEGPMSLISIAIGGFRGGPKPTWRGWVAAFSIAAADVSMAVFFARLGSNAYSFSRVLALLLSSAIATTMLQQTLSPAFVFGATCVALSGWAYREPQVFASCVEHTLGRHHHSAGAEGREAESENLLSRGSLDVEAIEADDLADALPDAGRSYERPVRQLGSGAGSSSSESASSSVGKAVSPIGGPWPSREVTVNGDSTAVELARSEAASSGIEGSGIASSGTAASETAEMTLEEDDLAILRLGLSGGGKTGIELNVNYHPPEPEPMAIGGVRGGYATPGRAVQPHIMYRPAYTTEELTAARGPQPNLNSAAHRAEAEAEEVD